MANRITLSTLTSHVKNSDFLTIQKSTVDKLGFSAIDSDTKGFETF